MLPVIEELIEEMNNPDLEKLLTWYSNKSALQGLGYLLEELQAENSLVEMLFDHFKSVKYPVRQIQNPNKK